MALNRKKNGFLTSAGRLGIGIWCIVLVAMFMLRIGQTELIRAGWVSSFDVQKVAKRELVMGSSRI
jgi:hypothetical protein